jgi:hypothetical protein
VPVLAKNKTATARLWTYVRDDRPFGGPDPQAAVFFTRATATASTPLGISLGMMEFSRPPPMPASAISTMPSEDRADHRGGLLEPRPP